MSLLAKIDKLLQGKKTYIMAFLVGVVGALKYLGIEIPDVVWPILGALGLGALRSAVNKRPTQ